VKEANSDPYGFYQLWLKSLKDGQEQILRASNQGMHDSREAWKQWLDATMATWKKTADMAPDPLGLTSQWLKMMDAVQEKLLAGETIPSDPFTFFKDWYDAISESWSSVVEQAIASEQFLEFNKQFLESYTSFSRAFRRANEEYLRLLQLPSRSDVSHVSELIVALEEKIDRLDDSFEHVDATLSQTAKSDAIVGLESRLAAVEYKMDTLHDQLEQFSTIQDLAQRFRQIEDRLDNILAELSKIEAHQASSHDEAKASPSQKSQRKKTAQAETAGKPSETES
jgi:polyhydroxyalkanoic acid synthase PhaR subunit